MQNLRNRKATRGRATSVMGAVALAIVAAACQPGEAPDPAVTSVTRAPTTAPTPSGSPSSSPTTKPAPNPTTSTPKPADPPTAKPTRAPVIVLRPGDTGSKVRSLQARLRQIGWFSGDVTDTYGPRTQDAVEGFQDKRGYPVTGIVDERTWDKLVSMTRRPTADELSNVKPEADAPRAMRWDVDQRCLTGRVMCISKSTRMLTWVVDGVPQYQFAVRFGSDELPTREGVFSVYKKKVDVISNLYNTPMPYSMFFSGGQAVHYSSNFARLGYSGASHGCVNVRDWDGIVRLYNESRIGDGVIIHW